MPFQNPGAGAAAPRAGEFDAPARRTGGGHVMGGAERWHGRRRPARVAGGRRRLGPREGEDRGAFSRRRRERQAAGDGKVSVGRVSIAQHGGHGTRFQRLLHGPQQACRLPERNGHEAVARQPQALQPVAIEPPVFALMAAQAAPQQRAALSRIAQAAEGEGEGKSHGSGLVAMGAGRHVMQPAARQTLRGQVAVEFRQAHHPGRGARALPLELRMPLFQPRNVRAQALDQRCEIFPAPPERCDRGASFPAPRRMMCRSHTHDCDDPDCSCFVP